MLIYLLLCFLLGSLGFCGLFFRVICGFFLWYCSLSVLFVVCLVFIFFLIGVVFVVVFGVSSVLFVVGVFDLLFFFVDWFGVLCFCFFVGCVFGCCLGFCVVFVLDCGCLVGFLIWVCVCFFLCVLFCDAGLVFCF